MNDARTDTIFALSSAPGRAAIAVIRISGPSAREALRRMVRSVPEARVVALKRLRHPESGDALDDALVLRFDGPKSETGEDLVELQVHGGRAVVASVIDALGRIDGLRPAEPGEFVCRAFANGKMDLTQVEGIADLIDAETELQRRQALRQVGGELQRLYDGWRSRLIEAQGLVEAAIDFSDEADVAESALSDATARVRVLAEALSAHLGSSHRGEILRDGFQIVIAGSPNAGKSSLLNALARRNVAIVSPEAGTTRDVIEVRLDLGGVPVLFADTAGLRRNESVGIVETEGMRRARERMGSADLILWLVDASAVEPQWQPPKLELDDIIATEAFARQHAIITVLNKSDLGPPTDKPIVPDFSVSARTGDGLDALIDHLAAMAKSAAGDGHSVVPTSARQRLHLERSLAAMMSFLTSDTQSDEIRAEELRLAGLELGRITGRIDPEDVLDQVFARFCIGK